MRTDRYEGKSIEDLRAELTSKTGENVRVARFRGSQSDRRNTPPAAPLNNSADILRFASGVGDRVRPDPAGTPHLRDFVAGSNR